MELRFVKRWHSTDPTISGSTRVAREELNGIIDMYNQWQLDGRPIDRIDKLLRYIEYGLQLLDAEEELTGMKKYVEEYFAFYCDLRMSI